jgi:hypothetical protein
VQTATEAHPLNDGRRDTFGIRHRFVGRHIVRQIVRVDAAEGSQEGAQEGASTLTTVAVRMSRDDLTETPAIGQFPAALRSTLLGLLNYLSNGCHNQIWLV